jgi:hypothetical protein
MFEQIFDQLEKHLRPAAVAQIGGFRPDPHGIRSWFGGNFHMMADEPWPKHNSKDMIPVIQIRVDELPVVPPQIASFALVTLFVSQGHLPIDFPSENGEGWLIRTYNSLDGMIPKAPPVPFSIPRSFQIRWILRENEGPGWLEILELVDDPDIGRNNDFFEACLGRYDKHPLTKVGGWPATIQQPQHTVDAPFVFQVASEEKPRWMLGDNGSMYFFLDKHGRWTMYWDCY